MSTEYENNEMNGREPGQEPYGGSGYHPEQGAYRMSGSQIPGGQPGAGENPYTTPNPGHGYQGPGAYGNTNPPRGYNYNVRTAEPKKKSGSRRVVALALVCALIGGLGGGAAVGMALRGGASAAPAAVEESKDQEPSAVETEAETKKEAEGTATNVFGQISPTASSGSGFIISEDGYIVTNNHVVAGAETLTVTMTSGEEFEAEIIGADAENDVALIKIDASGLPTVAIGESSSIEVGQQVCAIGNPLGELTNTLTVGYVSALDREINENGTPINMFQTDCAINAGNSGGPIFDMHGNVIGITTAKYSANGTYQASIEGIGFCVPIDDAMDIISDLLQYGYVKGRAYLGISCQAISSTVTQYYHLPVGVYVYSIEEGSAAEKAGLKEGDIITAIDGTEIESITELKSRLKEFTAGDTAILSVYRSDENGAETLELTVTFDEKQ